MSLARVYSRAGVGVSRPDRMPHNDNGQVTVLTTDQCILNQRETVKLITRDASDDDSRVSIDGTFQHSVLGTSRSE